MFTQHRHPIDPVHILLYLRLTRIEMLTPEQSDQTRKGDAHRAHIGKNIVVLFSMTTKETY